MMIATPFVIFTCFRASGAGKYRRPFSFTSEKRRFGISHRVRLPASGFPGSNVSQENPAKTNFSPSAAYLKEPRKYRLSNKTPLYWHLFRKKTACCLGSPEK